MNFIEVQEHQKKKTLSSLDRKQKICDTLAALFALIGYILEYSQVSISQLFVSHILLV